MRATLRGERLNVLLVLLFVVLLVTTAVALALTFTARGDAAAARHSAKADRAALIKVTTALRQQCSQQLTEQSRLRDVEQTDAALQRALISADQSNHLVAGSVRAARRRAYEQKLRQDVAFLATPPQSPAVCAVFADPLPIAFRAAFHAPAGGYRGPR